MATDVRIGKTHRSALIASDDPVVGSISNAGTEHGRVVFAEFFLADGRTVRVEMSPDVAERLALSLGRMASK